MAEVREHPVQPAQPRRRAAVLVLAVVVVALIAVASWAIANYFADRQERREDKWQACAERVYPPGTRSARVRQFLEDRDDITKADIERLGRADQRGQRRIEAECGERP